MLPANLTAAFKTPKLKSCPKAGLLSFSQKDGYFMILRTFSMISPGVKCALIK